VGGKSRVTDKNRIVSTLLTCVKKRIRQKKKYINENSQQRGYHVDRKGEWKTTMKKKENGNRGGWVKGQNDHLADL